MPTGITGTRFWIEEVGEALLEVVHRPSAAPYGPSGYSATIPAALQAAVDVAV